MEELSDATTNMAQNVQEILSQMMEIGNCVNGISQNVDQLYNNSEKIAHANESAKVSMDEIQKNSLKSVKAVNDIAEQIKQTNDSITEINKAVLSES